MAKEARFASVQEVSVAVIHPAGAQGSSTASHTEDVVDFRQGPQSTLFEAHLANYHGPCMSDGRSWGGCMTVPALQVCSLSATAPR